MLYIILLVLLSREAYLEPSQTFMMDCFHENSSQLLAVNYTR